MKIVDDNRIAIVKGASLSILHFRSVRFNSVSAFGRNDWAQSEDY